MWRALFLALGINAIILGTECMLLDRVELSPAVTQHQQSLANDYSRPSLFQNSVFQFQDNNVVGPRRVFKPREWMPWSLIATGIIIVVYTSSYQRRSAPAPA